MMFVTLLMVAQRTLGAINRLYPMILLLSYHKPPLCLKYHSRIDSENALRAQGSSSISTNTEDEDEHEDEHEHEDEDEDEGQGNKGTEDRTPSKPSPVGQKRGPGRPYKSTTPQGLPPTYHILLHAFYYIHHYHLGLRTLKSPGSDIGYSSDPAIAAQEAQEIMMLKQYVSEATWDMAYYPEGQDTPNPFMFWKDRLEAPAYALIKRYAFFFMSCFMYVFSAI
jgi:hypothetical protein